MYGWRARIGNISPTACSEILPYEFYRVAPEGVTFVSTNLVIRDARESSQVWGNRVWPGLIAAAHTLYHLPSLPHGITLLGLCFSIQKFLKGSEPVLDLKLLQDLHWYFHIDRRRIRL